METSVVIKKVVEGYNCKHAINLFIELAQCTHEMLVEHSLRNNDCGFIQFLVGLSFCRGLLTDNTDKKIELFQIHARKNYE